MNTIEFCMKYDTCKRCPLNKRCEAEYNKAQKKDDRKERKEKRKAKGMYE